MSQPLTRIADFPDLCYQLTVSDERYPERKGRRLGDFFAALERDEGIKIPRR